MIDILENRLPGETVHHKEAAYWREEAGKIPAIMLSLSLLYTDAS